MQATSIARLYALVGARAHILRHSGPVRMCNCATSVRKDRELWIVVPPSTMLLPPSAALLSSVMSRASSYVVPPTTKMIALGTRCSLEDEDRKPASRKG